MTRRPPFSLPAIGFNQLVDCRHGVMICNKNDIYVGESLRRYGEFSPGEGALFRDIVQPGMVVIEIGANIGAHSVALSQLVGPQGAVLAFEPQRIVFQTLCANLALNNCVNVYAFQNAVGARVGTITVPFLPPDRPENFGGLSLGDATSGEIVPITTLDSMNLPNCHFIKIDIEGMEIEALHGSTATIAKFRPMIYVEDDRPERSPDLIALLQAWRYQIYRHAPALFSPRNFADDQTNVFGNIASKNLLCVPAERQLVVNGLAEITASSSA